MHATTIRTQPVAQRGSSLLRWLLFAGAFLMLGAHAASTEAASKNSEQPSKETWYAYRMGGAPVGYISETTFPLNETGIGTRVHSHIVINRLGNKVEITQSANLSETGDGKLARVESEVSMSKQKTSLQANVKDKEIDLRSTAGGKQYRRTIPCPAPILGPEGIRRLTIRTLKNAGDTVSYHTFMPEFEDVREVTRTAIAWETPAQAGQEAGLKIEERIAGYPVKRTEWLDRQGFLIRSAEMGPFGKVEVVRLEQKEAVRSLGSRQLPPEMFDQTLIRSNVRLPSPRALDRVVLRLSPKNADLGIPSFAEGNQRLVRREANAQVIEVYGREISKDLAAKDRDADLREYLSANAIVQSDDSEIMRIAREAAGAETDPLRVAKALEAWVHRNMHFDLGIAVAPASEIVRNRRGTCCAYATLLTALARAKGIPARVAMGLLYTSGIWGGHFWTEVRIGDEWLVLDAVFPGPSAADPARIAGKRSSLSRGIGADMGALWQLFSNLDIRVLEYELGGKTTVVPSEAASYTLAGDVYRNPWLGVAVTKPAGFRFTTLDAVYPDDTVVALQGPNNEHVQLRLVEGLVSDAATLASARKQLHELGFQPTAGGLPMEVSSGHKAAVAIAGRGGIWLVIVEAERPPEVLREMRGRVEWSTK